MRAVREKSCEACHRKSNDTHRPLCPFNWSESPTRQQIDEYRVRLAMEVERPRHVRRV